MSSSSQPNASAGPSSATAGPSNPGGSNQTAGQKRRHGDHDSATPPAEAPAKKKTRKGGKKKSKPPQYHLRKDQVPAEQKGTKAVGYLHGYILLQVVRSDVPPPAADAAAIATFDRRLKPNFLADLQNALRAASGSNRAAVKMAADLRQEAAREAENGSTIAKDILKVKDTFLIMTFSLVLASGLESWMPDVFGPPDSLYNQAHELVYMESFRLVTSSFAYIFLGPTMSGINNAELVKDIGRAFLFAYIKHKAQVERRQLGKLVKARDENNSKKRMEFAVADKLPDRVVALLSNNYCHSDDESDVADEGNPIYRVNKKSIRSDAATAFILQLDTRCTKHEAHTKGRRWFNFIDRKRVRGDDPPESDLSLQMLKKVPLDFFAPSEFNDFPMADHYHYSRYGVALPPAEHLNNTDWKTMDKPSFMEKYGNDVLKQYDIPTQAQMDRDGNNGWDSDEVEQNLEEDEDMEQAGSNAEGGGDDNMDQGSG
ncbi:hypothetical protein C8R45DRAFT_1098713 [Mycena sanguinolenta]|nr:hypothetical protein C8R45DRAFT_1098713 [Mycena sanguinolenta]